MQRGSVLIEEKREPPKPQPSSDGSIIGRGPKAPPRTPYRKRKVGDKVRVPGNKTGIIKQIRGNGHESYLVDVPGIGRKWYTEFQVN